MTTLMTRAGGSQARAEVRQESLRKRSFRRVTPDDLTRKLLAILQKDDAEDVELVECFGEISEAMAKDAYLNERAAQIDSLEGKMTLLEDVGLSAEVARGQSEAVGSLPKPRLPVLRLEVPRPTLRRWRHSMAATTEGLQANRSSFLPPPVSRILRIIA